MSVTRADVLHTKAMQKASLSTTLATEMFDVLEAKILERFPSASDHEAWIVAHDTVRLMTSICREILGPYERTKATLESR